VPDAEQETDPDDGEEINHALKFPRRRLHYCPSCGREAFPDSRGVGYHGGIAREFLFRE